MNNKLVENMRLVLNHDFQQDLQDEQDYKKKSC